MSVHELNHNEAMKRLREDCESIIEDDNRGHYWDRFDEYEDAHLGAILPYEVQAPIGRLLQLRREIQQYERVGPDCLNYQRITALLREQLDKLYLGCVERFKDNV